jgi:hypothetical protein
MKTLARVVAVLMAYAAPAAADTINFMSVGKGANVEITSPVLGTVSVRAGELNWSSSGESLALLFYAYCVDATQWLQPTQIVAVQSSDDLEAAGVTDAGGKVAWLVNTYAPTVHTTGTDLDAAALQIAIWAAMYNESGSLTTGPFTLRSTGPVATQAQVFLDNLFSGPTGFKTSTTAWLNTASGQDQMIPTPEPGTLLLMGTGLTLAYRAARRKKL